MFGDCKTLEQAKARAAQLGATRFSIFSTLTRGFDPRWEMFGASFFNDEEDNECYMELAHWIKDIESFTELKRKYSKSFIGRNGNSKLEPLRMEQACSSTSASDTDTTTLLTE